MADVFNMTTRGIVYNERLRQTLLSLLQVVVGSCLLALCAQIAIPLPFTPVPITLQSAMVCLLGLTLGSRLGVASVALYLVEGCLGLPVFSQGHASMAWLLGPTGGYLIGFIPAAYLAGYGYSHLTTRKWVRFAMSYSLASLLIFFFGASQLALFVGIQNAFLYGVLPFIPGEILKAIALVTVVTKTGLLPNVTGK